MEALQRDYGPLGVRFHYIYKALAHPELNGYVTPYTQEERLRHVREAQRTLGSQIPWLCDTMDDRLKHALGDAPNSEFLLDSEGRLAARRAWSDPLALRADLARLVGPVENPTDPATIKLAVQPPPRVAPSGIVPRIQRPPGAQALRVTPRTDPDGLPFYVKLRAEAPPGGLRSGKTALYLGFHLDPLYGVHWNNLVAPIEVTIQGGATTQAQPATWTGPKVEAPTDIDPRELLVRVDGPGPLTVTARYFACNDDEGWCRLVTQSYEVHLAIDPDGGRAMPRSMEVGRPGPGAGPARAAGRAPNAGARRPVMPDARPADGMGRIVAVNLDAGTLTAQPPAGPPQTLRIDDATSIERDRQPARLADLKAGDRCAWRFAPQADDPPGDGPQTISALMVRTAPVAGPP